MEQQSGGIQTEGWNHESIKQTGIRHKKFFYKSLLNSAYLRSRGRYISNKKQNYFSLPDHQLAENLIRIFGFYEKTKRDKNEFVTKFVGIIVTITQCLLHSDFSLII